MKQEIFNRSILGMFFKSSNRAGLTLLVLTLTSVWAVSQTRTLSPPIGAAQVTFDYSVVNPGGNLDAFIPTGSVSGMCLVTLSESNAYFVGPSPAICVPREFNGRKGIRIIVIPYFASFPTDMTLTVTVYQQFANHFGQPVLYTGP
jgi:hypothetical protein